jgi:hypothetical protein
LCRSCLYLGGFLPIPAPFSCSRLPCAPGIGATLLFPVTLQISTQA